MKFTRLNAIGALLLLAMVGMAAWYYAALPDPLPTHWNLAGEVNGWTAKPWGVWLLPVIAAGTFAVLVLLPAISPRGFRLDSARRVYDIVVFAFVAFMTVIQWVMFQAALGRGPGVNRIVPALVGLLFIILGNYLGKFPKNFFIGIRTPWTLASDEVWNRTHRLAGWLFMLAGAVMLASGLTGLNHAVFVGVIVVAALVPVVYSLILYRRLHGFHDDPE